MNPNKPNIEGLSDYVGVRGAHPNLRVEKTLKWILG